MTSKTLNVH